MGALTYIMVISTLGCYLGFFVGAYKSYKDSSR